MLITRYFFAPTKDWMSFVMSKKQRFVSRAIHLVDIENQIGAPRCSPEEVREWFNYYSSTVKLGALDIVVIGVTNVHNMFSVKMSGMPARVIHKFGPDGADIALQAVMEDEGLERRFGRIYCASGDGGFTEQVSRLGSAVQVLVVARKSALAKRLELAAGSVIILPEITAREEAVATLRLVS